MEPEDMGLILAMAERKARLKWRREQEAAMLADYNGNFPSQRAVRARHFAYQVMDILSKHVPEACHNDAVTELMTHAYGHDWEIVQVPPERDAEYGDALKAAELTLAPKFVVKE